MLVLTVGLILAIDFGCLAQADDQQEGKAGSTSDKKVTWMSLFDGKSLTGWKSTQFGGEGEVFVEDGKINLEFGSSMTGITYTGNVPRVNYEISLEAMRTDGIDFFCGLTFPVEKSYCSFIVGGWAGSVVGLSSIDGKDASENDTTRFMNFKTGKWYSIRVRVTKDRIATWIDNAKVVDQDIRGRKISTRNEVNLSTPLGIAAWESKAALRNIRIRTLDSQLKLENRAGKGD
jgi:hypothetical protein